MRRRMGAAALDMDCGDRRFRAFAVARHRRRPVAQSALAQQAVLITVVDAHTGEPVVFDRDSGVDQVDAVAASTAGGPPCRIGDHRYIDGGYRSVDNADLAAGYGRVLVVSPFGGRSRYPRE